MTSSELHRMLGEGIDISLNVDDQPVRVPATKGRTKIVKRTVYRIEQDGDTLTGRVLRKNDPDGIWKPYVFNKKIGVWEQNGFLLIKSVENGRIIGDVWG